VWRSLREDLVGQVEALPMGDVRDLRNFLSAVIDRRAFTRLSAVLDRVKNDPAVEIIAGGDADDAEGYFVRPTLMLCADPTHEIFRDEYFGPLLAVHVYDDSGPGYFEQILDIVDRSAPYGLTGSIIATDRAAIATASERLRFTAGNFYINDKPTGAVVGQQPFGGARASGTNDKAGSILNLQRWVSPRAIKESLRGPTAIGYPHQLGE
jgi:1-pyrroline-5-carboxylate dehydrogenase